MREKEPQQEVLSEKEAMALANEISIELQRHQGKKERVPPSDIATFAKDLKKILASAETYGFVRGNALENLKGKIRKIDALLEAKIQKAPPEEQIYDAPVYEVDQSAVSDIEQALMNIGIKE